MKLSIIFFVTLISNICCASLEDVKTLTQISPGVWDVLCSNAKTEKVMTEKVLSDDLCNESNRYSKCVTQAQKILPENQIDDKEEIDEVINACAQGTEFTHKCLKAFVSGIDKSEADERSEIVKLINACQKSSAGVDKCIEFASKRMMKQRFDNVVERQPIIRSCSTGSVSTMICLREATEELGKFELDEVNELEELISACGKSRLEIDTCIQLQKREKATHLNYDERKEVLEIISKCNGQ